MNTHLDALCLIMAQQSIDYSVLSHKASILYLTGLPPAHPTEREAYLFINPESVVLYHSPFVTPPPLPSTLTTGHTISAIPMSMTSPLSMVVQAQFKGARAIGIEAEDLTVAERDRFLSLLKVSLKTVPIDADIKKLRMIKDAAELSYVRKAILITKKTLRWIDQFIYSTSAVGISELQLQRLIENKLFEYGATGTAFPTIVAFDSHTASPHHIPTSRKLKPSSVVLVDLGARFHNYCGDMTRTWCLGTPSPVYTKLEHTVKQAYMAAYQLVGKSASRHISVAEVDKAARSVIDKAGLGTYFIHTTGHGIGIEAHEIPSVVSNNPEELLQGMVITIEPGIYLPGKLGYRYENTIIV